MIFADNLLSMFPPYLLLCNWSVEFGSFVSITDATILSNQARAARRMLRFPLFLPMLDWYIKLSIS